jgi:hypothetical protein
VRPQVLQSAHVPQLLVQPAGSKLWLGKQQRR